MENNIITTQEKVVLSKTDLIEQLQESKGDKVIIETSIAKKVYAGDDIPLTKISTTI